MKMIDNNVAITFTIRVAMDTINLTQGWQKGATPTTTLERLARGDKLAMFQTRVRHERFRGNEPTKFLQR
jgi:hypothetical protein